MPAVVLCPDFQYSDEPSVEREVLVPLADIRAFRHGADASIPDACWREATALLCYHEARVDEALLKRTPRCRLVVRAGVGYDNVDLEAAGHRGIVVCNTPDYGTMDVADHAIALTLALLRGVVAYNAALFETPVAGWRFDSVPTIRRLETVTFGVVGLGRIGTATALRAKALGMKVCFFDPYRPSGTERALGVERALDLGELLDRADVLSLHTPLTAETRHLIDASALARCRRDMILINTARGAVVDLSALLPALLEGRVAAAALDVTEIEPLPADHPLMEAWRAPDSPIRNRLILTPHAAFYSPSSVLDLRRKSATIVRRFLETGRSSECVNAAALNLASAAPRAEIP